MVEPAHGGNLDHQPRPGSELVHRAGIGQLPCVGVACGRRLDHLTRTWRRLGALLWVVLPAMMVGPVMVAVGATSLFYLVAVGWLHFHVAKQHFGFVMLYKHKARERDRLDFHLDHWLLLVALMYPFAHFALHSYYPFLGARRRRCTSWNGRP